MPNKLLRTIDSLFIRRLGLRYALLTRDWMIHERMRFLVDRITQESGPIRVLDAGCGSGLALLYLHWYQRDKVSSYLGLDLDTRKLRTRYEFVGIPHTFKDIDLDSSVFCPVFGERRGGFQPLVAEHPGNLILSCPSCFEVEESKSLLLGTEGVNKLLVG